MLAPIMSLRLIRHAESRWNAEGRWQGQSNPSLTERGRRQARELAASLKGRPPQCIVSSDLRRARETAEILSEALGGVSMACDARLRERALGAWSGLFGHQVAARWPVELAALRAGDPTLRPPGGESLAEVRHRFGDFLRAWRAQLAGIPAALVTHGGVVRALFPGTRLGNAAVQDADFATLWQTLELGRVTP